MEKCRLCLGNKKNMRCIFDIQDDHSYAFKITSLTNVKILKNDNITDKICLGCRKKLKEAFDFKLMIESSDAALQATSNCKKIKFDNLKDIKIKIEIDEFTPKCETNVDGYLKDDEESFFYKGTTIKKVKTSLDDTNENGPLSVIDFLNTIKNESDNDFDDNVDVDYEPVSDAEDDEYLLPLALRKTKNNKKKTTAPKQNKERKNYNYKDKLVKVLKPIKPVFLSDIRVLPTKPQPKPKPTVPKKYKYTKTEMCYYCGKMTTSLKTHVLTHNGERSFKCEVCGKGFFSIHSLRTHEKTHINEKSFKCDQCVACFGTRMALKSHMISHSDEKKHVCDFCNKPFKRLGALRRHRLMHNVANKNIKCELCNMSFFSKYGLNHHMRIHTGERPYNCEICSQPYSYKHDFNRHCLKKHGIFLKRRNVRVMNEEVLKRERALMRDLMLKVHGYVNNGENINPFEGPQAAQAFELAVKALKEKQIPIDFHI